MHADVAPKHGATREEIDEALDVAVAINAGAALVLSAQVMDAVDAHPLGAGIHQHTDELRTRRR